MRHLLANIVTYALVTGLVLLSVLFAWMRSEQFVLTKRIHLEPHQTIPITDATPFDWLGFGEEVYRANCQNCHTVDGSGRGMYPPIQNMSAHLGAAGGRDYLLDLTLYGLYTGAYGAPMPPMPELSDAQIAAVTNYMLTQFAAEDRMPATDELYLPAAVTKRRGQDLSERAVARRRPNVPSATELGRGTIVPIGTDAPAVPEGTDQ